MYLSDRAKAEILRRRVRGTRQYQIARAAQIHPTVLSAMVNDMWPVSSKDERVVRLAMVLGIKAEDCVAPEHVA